MTREELEVFAQQLAPSGADYALWRKLASDALLYQRLQLPHSVPPGASVMDATAEQSNRDRVIRHRLN